MKKQKRNIKKVRRPTRGLVFLGLSMLCLSALSLVALFSFVPSFHDFQNQHESSFARALAARGEPWQEMRVNFSTRKEPWVPLAHFPMGTQHILRAREDARFPWHPGVDPLAVGAAISSVLFQGKMRGASTLDMQVSRLVMPALRTLKPWHRKLLEPFVAVALRARWGPDAIEEAWLNLVPLPGGTEGVPAAAKRFFGLSQLTLHTLPTKDLDALLAHAPRPGSPVATAWAQSQIENTTQTRLGGRPRPEGSAFQVPHLLQTTLEGRLPGHRLPPHLPRGRSFHTFIDTSLQAELEHAARAELARLRGRNVGNVALLVVENETGHVIAYVGDVSPLAPLASPSEESTLQTQNEKWVDHVVAPRQAGSTLKPFLYEIALERRYLLAQSLLHDTPYEKVKPQGTYRPRNYDLRFQGAVSAEHALANSLNVPAVRVLDMVGLQAFASRLEALGFALPEHPEHYGESLALGTLDVTLWNLVQAYATLARGAWLPKHTTPRAFRLQPFSPPTDSLFSAQTSVGETRPQALHRAEKFDRAAAAAREIARILSSNPLRASSFGLDSPLDTGFLSAVKTGTSEDMRDNWCIGFTPQHTVGVWVGNSNGEPMWDVSGVEGAAPLWREAMERLQNRQKRDDSKGRHTTETQNEESNALPRLDILSSKTALEPARIVSPQEGTVIARDPAIPDHIQRLVIEARAHRPNPVPLSGLSNNGQEEANTYRLVLNGAPLAVEDSSHSTLRSVWQPTPGRHTLALFQNENTVVDVVTFQVK